MPLLDNCHGDVNALESGWSGIVPCLMHAVESYPAMAEKTPRSSALCPSIAIRLHVKFVAMACARRPAAAGFAIRRANAFRAIQAERGQPDWEGLCSEVAEGLLLSGVGPPVQDAVF